MNKDTNKTAKKGTGRSLAEVARSVLSEAQNLGPKVAYSEPPQKLNPTDGPARGAIQDLSKTDNEGATGASTSPGAPTQKLSPTSDQGAVDDNLGASLTSNDEKTPAAKAVVGGRTSKVPGGKYPEQEKYNPTDKKIFAEDDMVEAEDEEDEKEDDDKEDEDDKDEGDHKEPDGDECSKNEELEIAAVIEQGLEEANVPEHMAAMFSTSSGKDLSEEFKAKASTVFEAAVREVATVVSEKLNAHYLRSLSEAIEEYQTSLSEQVDNYLGYVVEQWVAENEVAIESGLRSELTEEFIAGLHRLFTENYIDVPAEKVDVVESLSEKIDELEARLDEEFKANVLLRKELSETQKAEIFHNVAHGLTDVQIDKLRGLAEGISTSDVSEFEEKLKTLKESYMTQTSKAPATSGTRTLDSIEPNVVKDGKTGVTLTEEVDDTNLSPRMQAYRNSLARQVKSSTYSN